MIIYIVRAHGGEWDSSWESNVRAFKTSEKAEEYAKTLENNVPEYSEHLSRLIRRIYDFAHNQARKVPEEQYYDEYDWVIDAMKTKAYKKYQGYTEYREDASVWYSINEVEMEE